MLAACAAPPRPSDAAGPEALVFLAARRDAQQCGVHLRRRAEAQLDRPLIPAVTSSESGMY